MASEKSLATPRVWWEMLDEEFNFTLDAAANKEHHLVDRYYTVEDDALKQPWRGVVWCSPPHYGSKLPLWIKKAYEESRRRGSTVVMFVPVQVYRDWWHEYAMRAWQVRFLDGPPNVEHFQEGEPEIFEPYCLVIFKPHSGDTVMSTYPALGPGEVSNFAHMIMTKPHPSWR